MTTRTIGAAMAAMLWLAATDSAILSTSESLKLQSDTQSAIQQQTIVSNILKIEHDTATSVVPNLR